MSDLRFDGKTVLVTGGAGGFGSQTCRAFGERGDEHGHRVASDDWDFPNFWIAWVPWLALASASPLRSNRRG